MSPSTFEKDVRKDQGGRFLGRKDDKINLLDRSTFLKGHPLTLPSSTEESATGALAGKTFSEMELVSLLEYV
nr:hypothetical protein DBT53_02460 [Aerococcus mictus]